MSMDHPKDPTQADLDKFTASYGSGTLAVPKEWHDNALALWNDAMAKAKTVKAAWPFDWVRGHGLPAQGGARHRSAGNSFWTIRRLLPRAFPI